MKKLFYSILLAASCMSTQAADLANGQEINKSCALCHGNIGQGTPGKLSPRLAGLPKEYLIKATKEYRDGVRVNPLMVKTASINKMTDSDIEDISTYLSMIDIRPDPRFNIAQHSGNAEAGEEIYMDECKTCHARDGFGNPRKDAPPIAGQQVEYLYQSMKMFQFKSRAHDNDKEDETFDDYNDSDLMNITSFLATLDDSEFKDGFQAALPKVAATDVRKSKAVAETREKSNLQISDIKQTVVQMAINDGVGIQDSIDAMLSKAVELNQKLVAQQHVSKELEARGVESPYLSIFQFCSPMDARLMVIANPIFASYMPCRISMVEDQDGKMWLMMLNLDMLIENKLLPPDVVETAIRVNQNMLDIMLAGASGEF
ncbi:MAG: c-type cytochrome [Chromatiales bacterium]